MSCVIFNSQKFYFAFYFILLSRIYFFFNRLCISIYKIFHNKIKLNFTIMSALVKLINNNFLYSFVFKSSSGKNVASYKGAIPTLRIVGVG